MKLKTNNPSEKTLDQAQAEAMGHSQITVKFKDTLPDLIFMGFKRCSLKGDGDPDLFGTIDLYEMAFSTPGSERPKYLVVYTPRGDEVAAEISVYKNKEAMMQQKGLSLYPYDKFNLRLSVLPALFKAANLDYTLNLNHFYLNDFGA